MESFVIYVLDLTWWIGIDLTMAVEPMIEQRVGYGSSIMMTLMATVIGLVITYWWQQSKRYVKLGNRIPGPPKVPFIGNAHYFIGKNHNGEFSG